MPLIKTADLALRFLRELCALAALGVWGFRTGDTTLTGATLGIGAPLVAAVAWGAFVAPRARVAAPAAVRLAVELAVFATAVAALLATGRSSLAWALAIVSCSIGC